MKQGSARQVALDGNYQPIPQPRETAGVFAKNLKNNELLGVIEWNNWPIDRIWSILRYQEYWPGRIAGKGSRKFAKWKIGLFYKESSTQKIPAYTMEDQGNKKLLRLNDGYIELIPSFSATDLVKSLLKL
jgi:hypothetical protein